MHDLVRDGTAGIEPNAVSYTSLITAAKMDGGPKSVATAENLFRQVPLAQRNGRMYTAMIGAFTRFARAHARTHVST